MPEVAVIIGAGPAGLTAALELATRTDVRPIVLEQDDQVGGLARTVDHGGNRIDIGGHRFFSKSDRVVDWWLDRLPLQRLPPGEVPLTYQNRTRSLAVGDGPDPSEVDRVMLLRPRKSRIFHAGRFFDYPLSLGTDTLGKLGLLRSARIGASYLRARSRPVPEHTLEDFLVNRFGRELYETFFEAYTAKVWGRPCAEISAEWGAQRIKGLSLRRALADAVSRRLGRTPAQTETSLIEQFLYPKFGPGQMWEQAARELEDAGGEVRLGWRVVGFETTDRRITAVEAVAPDGVRQRIRCDRVFSTMPVQGLARGLGATGPVRDVTEGLEYRDFITVGVLLDDLAVHEPDGSPLSDNWIYIQEPDVHVGRLQLFHNWSPWMVAEPGSVWVGLEFFACEGDGLWTRSDADLAHLAVHELDHLGLARPDAVRDSVVLRMPKAYPGYFGTFDRFETVRDWLGTWENLVPIGRNGMHRYNNQDHSMLTAMVAVDQIAAGERDLDALWAVNAEGDYHESR